MSLVSYADSDDDADDISIPTGDDQTWASPVAGAKRKGSQIDEPCRVSKPPSLPSSLATLYASNVRSSTNDNPALHQGRRRQVPHVEGNWPSFVYLEWIPAQHHLSRLEDVVVSVTNEHCGADSSTSQHQQVRSFLRSDLGVRLPLHVSLSTPLILTTDNKDAFEKELTQNIRDMKLATFNTSPLDLRWVTNFDGTRYFLIMTLEPPEQDELQSLLSVCNRTAASFRLPQLYAKDSKNVGVVADTALDGRAEVPVDRVASDISKFHISIAWSLNEIPTSPVFMDQMQTKLKDIEITFDKVLIKIGNQVSPVPLQKALGRRESD